MKALDNICSILNDLLNVSKNNTKAIRIMLSKHRSRSRDQRATQLLMTSPLDALLEINTECLRNRRKDFKRMRAVSLLQKEVPQHGWPRLEEWLRTLKECLWFTLLGESNGRI
ncbi:Uncharacterised protein [Escherichia coli]|uniref:Uncharacterized protein n=1 Tax=Escherichia coli TaxID=562 RepID=A0A2X1LVF8_ECOLX|nr:Uncharacterised protein [Escherichia coli]